VDGSVSNLTEGSVLVDAVAEALLLPFGLNNDLDQHGTKFGLSLERAEPNALPPRTYPFNVWNKDVFGSNEEPGNTREEGGEKCIVHDQGGGLMSIEQEIPTVREAVGVFSRPETLQSAIDELLSSGFDRAELSLLASGHVVETKLGHQYEKVSDLEDVPLVSRAAYVSTEAIGGAEGAVIGALMYVGATAAAGAVVVSGGTLAAGIAAVAMAGGVGALIGTILAKWIGDHHANYLQEQMDHGGLLLWVRTWGVEDERRAVQILRSHSGRDVHVHAIPAWELSPRNLRARSREYASLPLSDWQIEK
jgi:hypothetical protein